MTLVEHRPVLIPAFGLVFFVLGLGELVRAVLGGAVFDVDQLAMIVIPVGLGGGLFLYTARRDSFRFDVTRRELAWTRRSLLGRRDGTLDFGAIEGVEVQRGPRCGDHLYRVALATTEGPLLLDRDFTANEAHQRKVAAAVEAALAAAA